MKKLFEFADLLEAAEQKKVKRYALLSLFSPVAELFSASMLIPIFSQAFSQQADAALIRKIIFLGAVLLLIGAFELVKNYFSAQLVMGISHSWSTKIYELLTMEKLGDHNSRTSSSAINAARGDVAVASAFVTSSIQLCVSLLTIGAYFCVMIFVARGAGLVSCAGISVVIILLYQRNRIRTTVLGERVRRLGIKTIGIINLTYGAYKEIKIDSRRDILLEKFSQTNLEQVKAQRDYNCMAGRQGVMLENLMQAGLFFLLAAVLATGMDLTFILPQAVVFLTLLIRMIPKAKQVVNTLSELHFGRRCMEMVRDNLERYRQIKEAAAEQKKQREKDVTLKQGIRIRDISFHYPGSRLILNHADMDIPAGESTVVIGPSGEGKTTLLDLVLGLLHPDGGHIWYDDFDLVDGVDAEGPCWADMGKVVSYIPQVVHLDNETVRDNVVFMAEEGEGDEEKVISCLKHAQIWDDVCQMPQGIDTIIGQNGATISGGQRQRIALARALYKSFEILILDEATAALDMETERAVIDSIRKVKGDKTLLMVTHHMSLAEECDHVYRIEGQKLRKVR